MIITLSNGKKVDLGSSGSLLDLNESEFRELIQICKSLKHNREAA